MFMRKNHKVREQVHREADNHWFSMDFFTEVSITCVFGNFICLLILALLKKLFLYVLTILDNALSEYNALRFEEFWNTYEIVLYSGFSIFCIMCIKQMDYNRFCKRLSSELRKDRQT